MGLNGPEPPEDSLGSVTPPPDSQLPIAAGMESDEEEDDYAGYQPLSQGPEGQFFPEEDEDEDMNEQNERVAEPANVPPIEPADREIAREVWSAPRPHDPIQMDNERAQQVMSAMANFALPISSIPEWAQSVSEDQWKQQLQDKIELLRDKQ